MSSNKNCYRSDNRRRILLSILLSVVPFLLYAHIVHAGDMDCATCHAELTSQGVVHPAVQMGCITCHSQIDATDVPHKVRDKKSKGLSADLPGLCFNCHESSAFKGKKHIHTPVQSGLCNGCHDPHSSVYGKLLISEMPDLCYACHEKTAFSGEVVHTPVTVGLCVTCHAPHQSDVEKLLITDFPALCFTCHDDRQFSKKNMHSPVAGGACVTCHNPHASEQKNLLPKRHIILCLFCHTDLRRKPHIIAGISMMGHPVGSLKKEKKKFKEDPARKGKEFYCGSCHDPHGSDWPKLYRYEADTAKELCHYCHEY